MNKAIILCFTLCLFSCTKYDKFELRYKKFNLLNNEVQLQLTSNYNLNALYYANERKPLSEYLYCPLESDDLSVKNIANVNYLVHGHDFSECLKPLKQNDSIYEYSFTLFFLKKDMNTKIPLDTIEKLLKGKDCIYCELIIIKNYFDNIVSKPIPIPVKDILSVYRLKKDIY